MWKLYCSSAEFCLSHARSLHEQLCRDEANMQNLFASLNKNRTTQVFMLWKKVVDSMKCMKRQQEAVAHCMTLCACCVSNVVGCFSPAYVLCAMNFASFARLHLMFDLKHAQGTICLILCTQLLLLYLPHLSLTIQHMSDVEPFVKSGGGCSVCRCHVKY